MEESVAADPVVEDVLEVEAAEVAKKEIEETVNEVVVEGGDSSASSASSDPLVLGGVAVAIGATVGAAAAMSQNSEESTPVEVAVTSGIDKASKLKEVRDEHILLGEFCHCSDSPLEHPQLNVHCTPSDGPSSPFAIDRMIPIKFVTIPGCLLFHTAGGCQGREE